MELAKHHTLTAVLSREQREREGQGEEAQWVRGVQMVDNNLYMLTTLLLLYVLSLKGAGFLNFNSLLAPVYHLSLFEFKESNFRVLR